MNICRVPQCGRKVRGYGYCQTHYSRFKKGRDVDTPIQIYNTSHQVCQVIGCSLMARAMGYCGTHYARYLYGRELDSLVKGHTVPIEKRLEQDSVKRESGCIEWLGVIDGSGRGAICYLDKKWKVHRLVWTLKYGEIPSHLEVCHKCDNPICLNIEHLFLDTHLGNVRDCLSKLRHSYGEEHYNAKLTKQDILEIKRLRKEGKYQTEIAKRFGITNGHVCNILNGKVRKHG